MVAEVDSEDESPRRRRPRFLLNRRSRSTASSDKSSGVASPAKTLLRVSVAISFSFPYIYSLPQLQPVATPRPTQSSPRPGLDSQNTLSVPSIEVQTTSPQAEDEVQPASLFGPHLEGGIPVPVSADPAVPDPASVWGTPRETSPQVEVSSKSRAEEVTRAAETGGLLKMTLKQPTMHSASGLFTPATDTDSSPSSPAIAVGISDDADEVEAGSSAVGITDQTSPGPQNRAQEDQPFIPQTTNSDSSAVSEGDNVDEMDVHDADADGDPDPEYHGEQEGSPEETQSQDTASPLDDAVDPFTLMGSDSKVAPGAMDDDSSSGERSGSAEKASRYVSS